MNGSIQNVNNVNVYSYSSKCFGTIQLIPLETNYIKVQALDTSEEYLPSDWSDVLEYTISLGDVNEFVNGLMPGYKLKSLTSMYIENKNSKGRFYTQGIFSADGEEKVVNMQTRYNDLIGSLNDAISEKYETNIVVDEYAIADYNSAQYLLNSNSYTGKMEEYRKQGWDFSVVTSCVGYGNIAGYIIYGTYKLTKSNDVLYLQNETRVTVNNDSTSEKINYTTKLLTASDRTLRELSCNECTEENGLLHLAKLLEAE